MAKRAILKAIEKFVASSRNQNSLPVIKKTNKKVLKLLYIHYIAF